MRGPIIIIIGERPYWNWKLGLNVRGPSWGPEHRMVRGPIEIERIILIIIIIIIIIIIVVQMNWLFEGFCMDRNVPNFAEN